MPAAPPVVVEEELEAGGDAIGAISPLAHEGLEPHHGLGRRPFVEQDLSLGAHLRMLVQELEEPGRARSSLREHNEGQQCLCCCDQRQRDDRPRGAHGVGRSPT